MTNRLTLIALWLSLLATVLLAEALIYSPQASSPYQHLHQRSSIHRLIPVQTHQRRFFFGLANAAAGGNGGLSTEEESEDEEFSWEKHNGGNSLSREDDWGEETTRDRDDLPDLICEKKDGMCKCIEGNPTTVNCDKAQLKSGRPLDSAFLSFNDTLPDFKAQVVLLTHNDIEVLRVGQIMPGQEANILSLDFSNNRIADVGPHAFDTFKTLRKLKLSHNHLRDTEMSVDWLSPRLGESLHQLYLDWNYLSSLDDGLFDNLGNLTKLVLDGNANLKLTARTFGTKLTKLKTLSLDRCELTSLNRDLFEAMPNLQELSLSGNPFRVVPLAVQTVPGLSILAMSDTNLGEIPPYTFKTMGELQKVYFRRMAFLTRVDDCAFCRAKKLELVDFSKSPQLSTINANAFGGSSDKESLPDSLQYLFVEECALTQLAKELVDWDGMSKVSLAKNPFDCTCDKLGYFLTNKKLAKKAKGSEPTCASGGVDDDNSAKGLTFEQARGQLNCAGDPDKTATGGEKTTIALVLLGLCGMVFVAGFLVLKQRRGAFASPASFFGRRQAADPQLGYANLPNQRVGRRHETEEEEIDDGDDGDERRLERDFHRGNRPEFV